MPEVRERYRKEMRRLLTEVWNEKAMQAELDQLRRLCQDDLPNARRARYTDSIAQFIDRQRAAVQEELERPAQDWPLPRREWGLVLKKPERPPMQVEGSFTAVVAGAWPTNAAGYFGQGTATLQFTVAGETRKPFTRSGAMAGMSAKKSGIEIVLADATGDLRWHLEFRMDSYRVPLKPSTVELGRWTVSAPLFQVDPVSEKRQIRLDNTGTLELTQVSTNLGGTISGKFKLNTTAFEEEKKQP